MNIRRLFKLTLVYLLVLGLLASSSSASGYVWCVSADGNHSALEFALNGDCSQDKHIPATGSAEPSALQVEAADCGPCLDISSAHQWSVSRSREVAVSVGAPGDFAPVAATACISLPERTLNTHRLVEPPPRIPDPILQHRTIVLLI